MQYEIEIQYGCGGCHNRYVQMINRM